MGSTSVERPRQSEIYRPKSATPVAARIRSGVELRSKLRDKPRSRRLKLQRIHCRQTGEADAQTHAREHLHTRMISHHATWSRRLKLKRQNVLPPGSLCLDSCYCHSERICTLDKHTDTEHGWARHEHNLTRECALREKVARGWSTGHLWL